MFQSARLTLTTWYLLIIMTLSLVFSGVVYRNTSDEIDRVAHQQLQQLERRGYLPPNQQPLFDPVVQEDAKERLLTNLGLLNLIILVVAGSGGYFLAGKTLQPIEKTLIQQEQFVSDASHELRTPLTVLRSEIEVGLRDEKLTMAQAKELLTSNLEEVVALQALSDNLLALSTLKTLPLTKVSLSKILAQAKKRVETLAREKQITIDLKDTKLSVNGEETSLIQLFTILLDNAIKYGSLKSIVKISTEKNNKHATIKVSDSGTGILDKDLPYIFNRFYRADTARSKEIGGYGLGLSIAKKIVNQHHGNISVKSKKGEGTTFTILIPLF